MVHFQPNLFQNMLFFIPKITKHFKIPRIYNIGMIELKTVLNLDFKNEILF